MYTLLKKDFVNIIVTCNLLEIKHVKLWILKKTLYTNGVLLMIATLLTQNNCRKEHFTSQGGPKHTLISHL